MGKVLLRPSAASGGSFAMVPSGLAHCAANGRAVREPTTAFYSGPERVRDGRTLLFSGLRRIPIKAVRAFFAANIHLSGAARTGTIW